LSFPLLCFSSCHLPVSIVTLFTYAFICCLFFQESRCCRAVSYIP
jgi:hypothetical protein